MSRHSSHSSAVPALFLVLSTLTRPCTGSDTEGCPGFCWVAPEGCPSQQSILERVHSLTGEREAEEPQGFMARVIQDGDSWRVHLVHDEQERVISAATCAELGEATAVVVSLALAPDTAVAPSDSTSPEAPSPIHGLLTETETSNAGRLSSGEEGSSPAPSTQRVSADIDVAVGEPDASPTEEVSGLEEAWPDEAVDESWRFSVHATGVWEARVLPESTLGVRLGAAVHLTQQLRLAAHGMVLSPVEQGIRGAPEGGNVEYGYASGGAEGCWSPAGIELLFGCAGGELGWLSAEAPGLANGEQQVSVVPSLSTALRWTPRWRAVAFDAGVEAAFPLLQDSFTVNREQQLHQIPSWTLRLVAGLAVAPF